MTAATVAPPTAHARPVADVVTMVRRSLLRAIRYPGLTAFLVLGPLVMLLLFVYVFGGAFGAGVAPGVTPGAEGRAAYLDYIAPTLLILTIWWKLSARHWFTGPKMTIDKAVIEAFDDE